MKDSLIPVVKAMLKDDEFMCGGVFSKEKYYSEKYNLTMNQIVNMQTCIYYALHIRDEDFCRRVDKICE